MGVHTTVVFTDLFGSTRVFEALGNAKATQAVMQVTTWIAKIVEAHGGRVVKMLGDGVLALFDDSASAINAVVEMQRLHQKRMTHVVPSQRMPIRVGVASGDVEIVAGDCYGDAVNIAARLSDLSGAHQIWANSAALDTATEADGVRFRILGPISIRGRAEPCTVYQIDWQEDVASDFLTMQAEMDPQFDVTQTDALGGQIELSWLDTRKTFQSFEMPIHIGRMHQAEFVVNDPRVSRTHARIDWRNGSVMLVDLSSYGCWVRFSGGGADLLLRREECALHGHGEIALGTSFADLSAPTVHFSVA
ncbi:MAG: adenylate/guanylate cyclase domain-containing protein [Gammaproteobacteria bacterium]|uniref:adenylate/guanylate cyclase domain-containing protein n=1 Tax=Rhodoferax sp. TaxID=50421 RepID=UPI0017D5BB0D|nr:adenylate/guanylate cyclase domain-containing protein [Rhodoferax sp.]MBU3899555.1 adenylate/guanylate cyclase domain-containing protein [Gammaproteobacteria bacterium]MBA3059627.1 adenylate/guanylate cyclase domain-containing protein [Rhodoferax sp.]MBU3997076.1 adenylate/guanylate cyclase domain-containing protein [Gammaproteobacteria bacterium]MBU4018031.1 adenylate/guanylate cyclase domain-containing protein [Gammaproteobacteria bacterium]MBU4080278.1 adenylate/guanylate cyclase domain-